MAKSCRTPEKKFFGFSLYSVTHRTRQRSLILQEGFHLSQKDERQQPSKPEHLQCMSPSCTRSLDDEENHHSTCFHSASETKFKPAREKVTLRKASKVATTSETTTIFIPLLISFQHVPVIALNDTNRA